MVMALPGGWFLGGTCGVRRPSFVICQAALRQVGVEHLLGPPIVCLRKLSCCSHCCISPASSLSFLLAARRLFTPPILP